ncbi:hypothetical protein CTEN210_04114 [Chaetoceros tenuissimus]|uniref:Uncharacterized protein n=1 Tax=Chaetoceros tenuissimus TaxID=426638 RepID=A0AAD3CN02_9STRA|nr:hypothetical protein CTEN210_04114 [Chaetoceros tenuissimus]
MNVEKRMKTSHAKEEEPSASFQNIENENDVMNVIFSFIPGSYVTIAPVSKQFYSNYSTRGIHESAAFNSADSLLKIGRNRRTTVDAVSDDIKLTEYCFVNSAPKEFMMKVYQSAAMKSRKDILECANIFGIEFEEMIGENVFLLEKLAKEGNLEMIQYFDNKLGEGIDERDWLKVFYEVDEAAENDHLHIMKWIFQEKCQNDDWMNSEIEAYEHILEGVTAPKVTQQLCENAAEYGNIHVLEHCQRNDYHFDVDDADNDLCICAVENTDKEQALVTLKWLHRHGCRWNEDFCKEAVSNDNLEALKWARDNGCPWDEETLREAARKGNIPMIEYCLQNQCPMTEEVCKDAMENKDHDRVLEVLKLLRKYSCPWDQWAIWKAIENGHFEAMLWAKRNGSRWTELESDLIVKKGDVSTIEKVLKDEPRQESPMMQTRRGAENALQDAAKRSNAFFRAALSNDSSSDSLIIQKLKLLREYGYEWDAKTTEQAAEHGRLLVLQWLRHLKCPMDESSCAGAVASGNIEILKYTHEVAGCELSKEAYAYCFDEHGLHEPRSHYPTTVRDSHRELLKYLEKNDCPRVQKSDWKIAESYATNIRKVKFHPNGMMEQFSVNDDHELVSDGIIGWNGPFA